jgi:hypothetical protein
VSIRRLTFALQRPLGEGHPLPDAPTLLAALEEPLVAPDTEGLDLPRVKPRSLSGLSDRRRRPARAKPDRDGSRKSIL